MIRTVKKTTLGLLVGGALALFAGESALAAFTSGNYIDENGSRLFVGVDGKVTAGAYVFNKALMDWIAQSGINLPNIRYAHSCNDNCPKGISPTGTMRLTALSDDTIKAEITGDDGEYKATHVYHLEGKRK